uniref:Uncharacterized protein n=1 Tax=Mycena chlorophos TaxID=658473 RepID=A0ABQ0L6D5_MYCCL|nr:predicted protein [Mycena chlorophos]
MATRTKRARSQNHATPEHRWPRRAFSHPHFHHVPHLLRPSHTRRGKPQTLLPLGNTQTIGPPSAHARDSSRVAEASLLWPRRATEPFGDQHIRSLKSWPTRNSNTAAPDSSRRARRLRHRPSPNHALAHSQSADAGSTLLLCLRAEPPSTTRSHTQRLILNADSLALPQAQPRRWQHPLPPQTGASEHSAPPGTSPLRATTIYGTKHHGSPTACGRLVPQMARHNSLLSAVSEPLSHLKTATRCR